MKSIIYILLVFSIFVNTTVAQLNYIPLNTDYACYKGSEKNKTYIEIYLSFYQQELQYELTDSVAITKFSHTIDILQNDSSLYSLTRNYKSNVNIIVNSNLGPVPIELDEMYPFAQSIFPKIADNETEKEVRKVFCNFTKNKNIIWWKGNETLKEIKKFKEKKIDKDLQRISAVSDIQFGKVLEKSYLRVRLEL